MKKLTWLVLLAPFVFSPTSSVAQVRGWTSLDLPSGGRATRYLPAGVEVCEPSPLIVFLHGAGGTPEAYHSHLEAHAEAHAAVLLLPESSGAGWSGADVSTITEAMSAIESELTVDERRTYFAGHSAGGAFAYLLVYEGSEGIAAVFSMSAPFFSIATRSDSLHAAPMRMYYGADDPNYTGGSADALEAQWARLGVPSETDVRVGFGHSTWPPDAIGAGFEHLLAVRYPGAPTPSTCPGADAGPPSLDAGTPMTDAGEVIADSGVAGDSGGVSPDAAAAPDAGPRGGAVSGGCGCSSAGHPGSSGAFVLALAALVSRRRRSRRSRG